MNDILVKNKLYLKKVFQTKHEIDLQRWSDNGSIDPYIFDEISIIRFSNVYTLKRGGDFLQKKQKKNIYDYCKYLLNVLDQMFCELQVRAGESLKSTKIVSVPRG